MQYCGALNNKRGPFSKCLRKKVRHLWYIDWRPLCLTVFVYVVRRHKIESSGQHDPVIKTNRKSQSKEPRYGFVYS